MLISFFIFIFYMKLKTVSINTNILQLLQSQINNITLEGIHCMCSIVGVVLYTMSYKRNRTSNLCSINALLYLTALPCSLTRHVPLPRTVIIHRWHAVCFSPFLSACLRLMIQISGVHPDLYRTSPLIQPFSPCHHLVNWSFPDVSSWRNAQTVTSGCGIPRLWLLFASRWQISGNNYSDI